MVDVASNMDGSNENSNKLEGTGKEMAIELAETEAFSNDTGAIESVENEASSETELATTATKVGLDMTIPEKHVETEAEVEVMTEEGGKE